MWVRVLCAHIAMRCTMANFAMVDAAVATQTLQSLTSLPAQLMYLSGRNIIGVGFSFMGQESTMIQSTILMWNKLDHSI